MKIACPKCIGTGRRLSDVRLSDFLRVDPPHIATGDGHQFCECEAGQRAQAWKPGMYWVKHLDNWTVCEMRISRLCIAHRPASGLDHDEKREDHTIYFLNGLASLPTGSQWFADYCTLGERLTPPAEDKT